MTYFTLLFAQGQKEQHMIRSMTGYGRGEADAEGEGFLVEAKSVNHRFLDVRSKLPSEMFSLDLDVNRLVQDRFARGRFEILVTRTARAAGGSSINRETLLRYLDELRNLRGELDVEGAVTFDTLLTLPGVIEEAGRRTSDAARDAVLRAVGQALEALKAMREREGAQLGSDLRARVERILEVSGGIEQRIPQLNQALHDRLRTRLKELLDEARLDAGRVEQEAAFLVERSDVTEELVRLGIHCRQFLAYLDEREPVGRKMDFLLQEMNREINTLGSKIADADIARSVVDMKSELERVREQVQNVE